MIHAGCVWTKTLLLFIGFKNLISCTGLNGNYPRESSGALWHIIYTFLSSLLFALPHHYSFFFSLFHSTSFMEQLSFFIFFSGLFPFSLECCGFIVAMYYIHIFHYTFFSNMLLTFPCLFDCL